ncbi:M48 family metallopeptidase [Oxalobacter paraformigenes]|uniref:YgjP-like metallopeptidase domain-containing protein n=1 Tax=Oxalobacter paraformigenes TaxID=556268 RepID=C3X4D6_9BURK|nr:SprT family zinc-dependent metalloprotease [Oxalobacter paraformigenes]EEO28072.1 hypothetical protein OFAG_01225 [Oxalobacter paraformigenes]
MAAKRSPLPAQPDLFDFVSGALFRKKPAPPGRPPEKNVRPSKQKKHERRDEGVLRTINLNGQTVSYLLRRSGRRTIGFLIDESGLKITAPRRSALYAIENALYEKRKWILDKLDFYRRQQTAKPATPDWENGTVFPYLGKKRVLRLENSGVPHPVFRLDKDRLDVHIAFPSHQDALAGQVKNWLKSQATRIFEERLHWYAGKMNVRFDAFGLSNARTRWGSCSAKRHIRLNWRLIHCDLFLIDYVVIHELAHLLEMNHSPRFWAIVKTWCPDYGKARKQLQNLSPLLFSLFPETD